MSFPNFPEKYQGEPVMRPEDTIAMRKRFGKFPKVDAPEGLVLCLKNDLPTQLRWQVPVQKVGKVMGDFYLVRSARGRVGVLSNFGIGAPVVASLTEEMIAWGVKRFVILSWGGALQTSLNVGDIIITERAIRDEGVSHHYLPAEKFIHADAALTVKLKNNLPQTTIGSTWTTDAPYRETRDEVIQYQAEGIQVVEMEIAALFALAKVRGVQASAVVVAADKLANLTWEMPSDMKRINSSFEMAYRAAIQALNEGA
ncbi:MAG: nucleoside phosphorylase [Anaerolineales bacterium]|uniref:nucleoside phosphorylase n=1 Tax=Candidatus Villigracilis vicinus TaxID=3140679 RepID=UPI0031352133|nr:nucleoside phosphorylase [Anaerolineales bacterium]